MTAPPPTPAVEPARSWRRRWQDTRAFLEDAWRHFNSDRIPLAAGAIAFFTLLSLVPLLLLAISLPWFFISPEEAIRSIPNTLGEGFSEALGQILVIVKTVIRTKAVTTVVAIVFGLWSGSQVFLILESAINLVWHSHRARPFWLSRLLAMLMVIIVGTFMFAAVLISNFFRVLDSLQIPLWGRSVQEISTAIRLLVNVVVPLVLVTAIFTAVYRILPTKKVTLRSVIPGAIFAGVLWSFSLHIFGVYTAYVGGYPLYGSLGGLVLLMFWFYYSAFIMLLGAELSAAYHRRLVEEGNPEEREVEEQDRALDTTQPATHPADEMPPYYGFRGY